VLTYLNLLKIPIAIKLLIIQAQPQIAIAMIAVKNHLHPDVKNQQPLGRNLLFHKQTPTTLLQPTIMLQNQQGQSRHL
jgi:hypothetical protein